MTTVITIAASLALVGQAFRLRKQEQPTWWAVGFLGAAGRLLPGAGPRGSLTDSGEGHQPGGAPFSCPASGRRIRPGGTHCRCLPQPQS